MAKGIVLIDTGRCKGCELCTTVCPKEILFMAEDTLNSRGYHPAILVDPENACTGCALCAVICPDTCITVYRAAVERVRPIPTIDLLSERL